ncbi:hypothetical protein OsI_01668 [Oryza sativa Indica Group]|uniref:Uncharacterized protein n=1 Tax=Oryza sativa subsp. indica TaxID=39946 RepID=A2WP93_ORYSI|nr:hypothetical protein OsI_01668 [Oryza sativa Indica Group]
MAIVVADGEDEEPPPITPRLQPESPTGTAYNLSQLSPNDEERLATIFRADVPLLRIRGGTPIWTNCGGDPPIHSPSTSRATTRADRGRGLWRLASEQPPTAAGDDVLVERWQWRVRCVLCRGEHDAALALGRQRTELEEEGCRAGAKPGFEISGVWGEDKP